MEEQFADFECKRCGKCCRKHGTVRLNEVEVNAIADFLNMEVSVFTNLYTDLLPDRSGLTLTEFENGDCIFFREGAGCLINPVKPKQCRDFPYYWNFPGWEEVCEGGKAMKKKRSEQ